MVNEQRGKILIPAATIGVLFLGPGTDISHRAMELIGAVGCCVIWVGEQGVRYYAHGQPLTHTASLLINQAKLVSNERLRLKVARQMYQMRFPNEDVSSCNMQVLRGKEGARIRGVYREASKKTGIPWNRRDYKPENFDLSDPINKALSAAHACLYGIVHSAIVALGCSPGLGFIHTGHERSFVYDIADLYKAEISIPLSFQITADEPDDIGSAIRHRIRDEFEKEKLIERITRDIITLLDAKFQLTNLDFSTLELWDKDGNVNSGVAYNYDGDEL